MAAMARLVYTGAAPPPRSAFFSSLTRIYPSPPLSSHLHLASVPTHPPPFPGFSVRFAGASSDPVLSSAEDPLIGGGDGNAAVLIPKNFSFGAILALSVAVALLIQPFLASQASASVQSASGAGGPAVAAIGGRLVRSELLSSAWTGFLAGCLHTLSGPDHLAALAPLSIGRSRLESAAVGALWGCGHDAGQVIFGLLFLFLKDQLHIEVIRTWGTRIVGMTLLVIGAMGIREASEIPTPCVALGEGVEPVEAPKKKIGLATFATGIVHGLQPDALMMVLPALALPSRLAGAAYLGMFLVGTVIAMGSYTVFIGSCSQALKDRIPRITEKLTWASSLVAIALGFAILISQYFGYSLY